VELQQLARGLWRWTAPHPDWEPNAKRGSPADWPELVGSVAYDNGDVGRSGLRVCPDSWLRYLGGRTSPARLRQELQKLLDLPVRMVLVSHGEPVLRDAKRKLGRAVA
jgi:hypothetical protein